MSGESPCFLPNLPFDTVVTVYLGLGTNLGDRAANLSEALRRIAAFVQVERQSSVYETEPVGYAEQPDFWNMVVSGSTDLPAGQLMDELLAVERALGRQRTFKNAPRIIDIDILLYDDIVTTDHALQIPHPRMQERAFVLRPLLEIAPDARDPRTREPYADALRRQTPERAVAIGELSDLASAKGV